MRELLSREAKDVTYGPLTTSESYGDCQVWAIDAKAWVGRSRKGEGGRETDLARWGSFYKRSDGSCR